MEFESHAPAAESEPPRFPGRFIDKTVLITGPSERGIGGAIAERIGSEGARLILWGRTRPERLFKRLRKLNAPFLWTQVDVTQAEQVEAALQLAGEHYPQLDVLVNNAGLETARPFESFSEQQWDELLAVNLTGAARLTRLALPRLTAPGGVIVNISSVLGLAGCAGFAAYSATKAGLVGLSQSLAWELGPRGIRVLCVAPALVHTPMILKHAAHISPALQKQIDDAHPQDVGSPHDVAAAVAFLASSEARWITGVTLPLGWSPAFPLPTAPFFQE